MSLYDDLDTLRQKSDEVAGWSSGIKLFQSQLQVKKAASSTKRDGMKKVTSVLAPVFDLNSKKDEEGDDDIKDIFGGYGDDMDWNFSGEEYDPLWPNDYEKVVKDLRELREKEKEREDEERQKKREERRVRESRFEPLVEGAAVSTPASASTPPRVEEDNEEKPVSSRGGAAIAPPPSLMEQVIPKAYGASVAAKIMAKYGFKEGQGLGKKEQGISMALQVEKTSKRGGRIVHEKDIMPPPPPAMPPPLGPIANAPVGVTPLSPPRPSSPKQQQQQQQASITEIMKAPSKVVLLKNMVGPGEVDDDLEPEVKDECNTKYGEVVRVIIYELPNAESEEAVRIFVEFKRIESAIKAVVDLNGRFFGGRQVKAGFYPWEKLENLELLG
ncbi:splicing factor 45 [Rhodnius prolixus]|uniref:Splicing factor 45 n=1 Tax=Rhodnius neglectus TaxID=72488 RepID=A0A0P4VNX4_9HEMI